MTDKPIGLYIHIPFCRRKCAYCNFYSSFFTDSGVKNYISALIRELGKWGGLINRPIDTIYLGGGTPSLLGEDIITVIKAVYENFKICENPEITVEINPEGEIKSFLKYAKEAGVNRISIGIQSGNDNELKLLGRLHSAKQAQNAVPLAREYGFKNISADIMLSLPNSTESSLKKSIDFICKLEPQHISAYILSIEKNTLFYKNQKALNLPDEEMQASQYLYLCKELKYYGYRHYEISNFCKEGFESKHNLKYWEDNEYLGIGPSAHSFLNGKRFYYPNNILGFINGNEVQFESTGGDEDEYIMLHLRLDKGLNYAEYKFKYKKDFPEDKIYIAKKFEKAGLVCMSDNGFSLTDEGMLLSNSIIAEIIGV